MSYKKTKKTVLSLFSVTFIAIALLLFAGCEMDTTSQKDSKLKEIPGNTTRGVTQCNDTSPIDTVSDISMSLGADLLAIKQKIQQGQPVKIVAYGDSVTWGFSQVNNPWSIFLPPIDIQVEEPYPLALETFIRSASNNNQVSVINNGVPGWTTYDALAIERFWFWVTSDHLKENVLDHNPDLTIIMYGINDNGQNVSEDDYADNLAVMVNEIKTKTNSKILILSPTIIANSITINNTSFKYGDNAGLLKYVRKAHEVAVDTNVGFINIHNSLQSSYSNNPCNFLFDQIHPKPEKYKEIAATIAWYLLTLQ